MAGAVPARDLPAHSRHQRERTAILFRLQSSSGAGGITDYLDFFAGGAFEALRRGQARAVSGGAVRPYELKEGWERARAGFTELCIDTLSAVAPGLRESILHAELLTPPDIEREFGMSGGHWHHGDLAFDQFFMVRPVPGAAQHSTPLPGLYLCGAGCHPGGGVMGIAGRNAAERVLKEIA